MGPEGTKLSNLWTKQTGQENVWDAETSEFHSKCIQVRDLEVKVSPFQPSTDEELVFGIFQVRDIFLFLFIFFIFLFFFLSIQRKSNLFRYSSACLQ